MSLMLVSGHIRTCSNAAWPLLLSLLYRLRCLKRSPGIQTVHIAPLSLQIGKAGSGDGVLACAICLAVSLQAMDMLSGAACKLSCSQEVTRGIFSVFACPLLCSLCWEGRVLYWPELRKSPQTSGA